MIATETLTGSTEALGLIVNTHRAFAWSTELVSVKVPEMTPDEFAEQGLAWVHGEVTGTPPMVTLTLGCPGTWMIAV
jgi:hypothetical protein